MPELYSFTAARVASDVRTKFGDAAGIRLREADLISWINDGQREIGLRTGFLEKMAVTNLLEGVRTYDLKQLLRAERMFSYGSIIVNGVKIRVIPHQEFLAKIAQYDSPPATGKYPQFATDFDDKLDLWPAPTESVTRGITIYGSALPADITELADFLTVPDRFFETLTNRVLAQAYEFDERPDESAAKIEQSETGIVREMGRQNASPDDEYPTISWDDERYDY